MRAAIAALLIGCGAATHGGHAENVDVYYARLERQEAERLAPIRAAKAAEEADRQRKEQEAAEAATVERDRIAAKAVAERKAFCDETRLERVAEAQKAVEKWGRYVTRIGPHARMLEQKCDFQDTRGIRVERAREQLKNGEAWVVRTKDVGSERELVCSVKLPQGVSKDDVEFLLTAPRETGLFEAVGVSWLGSRSSKCVEADAAVDLRMNVTILDKEGIQALRFWRAPAKALSADAR